MAIKAYVGKMGSGKSYEVVSTVILGALRTGRRVVSNISGLNVKAIQQFLEAEGIPKEQQGVLIVVTHDQVSMPDFFRTDNDEKEGTETIIQPGDLVALDEVWRFWQSSGAIPERHMNFFRMHRHFVHAETGLTCDVALISQQVSDFNSKIRGVIEETYVMHKATAVGKANRYRVDVHTGGKDTRSSFIRQEVLRQYDPKYFPLYSSHSQNAGGVQAKEVNIDNRGNIFKNPIFRFGLPIAVISFIAGGFYLWRFLYPVEKKPPISVAAPGANPQNQPSQIKKDGVSEIWRVYGWYSFSNDIVVVLKNDLGRKRLVYNPPNFRLNQLDVSVVLDGDKITTYSGMISKQADSEPKGIPK